MTEEDSIDIVELLLAAYPGARRAMTAPHVEAMGRAYFAGLCDVEADAVRAAINRVVKSSKFLPTIAEIREAVVDGDEGPKNGGGSAWASVLRAMRAQGAYRTPGVDFAFADPLVLEALGLFNWRDLCVSEDLVADRAHFVRHYDELAKRTRKEKQIAVGAGAPPAKALPPSNANEPKQLAAVIARLLPGQTS